MKPIAINRKAKHDYFLSENMEAGISLRGFEVKSIREGRVNLKDSYVRIMKEEAFVVGIHISTYSKIQGYTDVDPTRTRKLLLHRHQIDKLMGATGRKGYTIVPVSLYFKKGLVKLEIAVAKGKREFDKRQTIKKRIHDRETAQAIKKHSRKSR